MEPVAPLPDVARNAINAAGDAINAAGAVAVNNNNNNNNNNDDAPPPPNNNNDGQQPPAPMNLLLGGLDLDADPYNFDAAAVLPGGERAHNVGFDQHRVRISDRPRQQRITLEQEMFPYSIRFYDRHGVPTNAFYKSFLTGVRWGIDNGYLDIGNFDVDLSQLVNAEHRLYADHLGYPTGNYAVIEREVSNGSGVHKVVCVVSLMTGQIARSHREMCERMDINEESINSPQLIQQKINALTVGLPSSFIVSVTDQGRRVIYPPGRQSRMGRAGEGGGRITDTRVALELAHVIQRPNMNLALMKLMAIQEQSNGFVSVRGFANIMSDRMQGSVAVGTLREILSRARTNGHNISYDVYKNLLACCNLMISEELYNDFPDLGSWMWCMNNHSDLGDFVEPIQELLEITTDYSEVPEGSIVAVTASALGYRTNKLMLVRFDGIQANNRGNNYIQLTVDEDLESYQLAVDDCGNNLFIFKSAGEMLPWNEESEELRVLQQIQANAELETEVEIMEEEAENRGVVQV